MSTHHQTPHRTTADHPLRNFYSGLKVFRKTAHNIFMKGTTQAEREAFNYRPTDWDSLFRTGMGDSPEKARKAGIAAAKEILG